MQTRKYLMTILGVSFVLLMIASAFPVRVAAQEEGLFKITLVAPGTANQARRQWAQIVRNAMQQVGIDASVAYLGWGAVFDRILFAPKEIWGKTYAEGGFDAFFVGQGWTVPMPVANLLPYYGSDEKYFPPGQNWYLYKDTNVDKMATEYIRTLDEGKRIPILKDLQAYLQENGPDFLIFYDRTVAAYSPQLGNFDPLVYYAPHWLKGPATTTVAVPGEWTAFNPVLSNSWYDIPFLYGIFDMGAGGGITMNYENQFIPATYTSWTSSPDGLEWTMNVRQGMKWHDGVEVTADDFIYSLWIQLTPETGAQSTGYWTDVKGNKVTLTYSDGTTVVKDFTEEGKPVKEGSASAVGKYTIKAKLPEVFGIYYPDSILGEYPMPKHVLEAIPIDQWSTHSFNTGEGSYKITKPDGTTVDWTGPVGLGPYVYKSYDRTKQIITLAKNPDYWNRAALEAQGLFTIETFNTVFITEKEAALAALKNGEVQILDYNYHFEKDIKRFDPTWGVTKVFDAYGLQELGVNMMHPVFGTGTDTPLGKQDPTKASEAANHVRRAIDHLIPRQLIIDNLMDGFPRPGIAFVLPPQIGFNKDLKSTEYSLDEARKHLQLAGYEPKGGVEVFNPQVPPLFTGTPVALSGRIINAETNGPFPIPLRLDVQASTDEGKTWTKVGETSTDSYGNYQTVVTPPGTGAFWYRVFFPGSTLPLEEWINIIGGTTGEDIKTAETLSLIPPIATEPVKAEVGSLEDVLKKYMPTEQAASKSDVEALNAQIQTLTTGLYAAIALIVIVGAGGFYLALRRRKS